MCCRDLHNNQHSGPMFQILAIISYTSKYFNMILSSIYLERLDVLKGCPVLLPLGYYKYNKPLLACSHILSQLRPKEGGYRKAQAMTELGLWRSEGYTGTPEVPQNLPKACKKRFACHVFTYVWGPGTSRFLVSSEGGAPR